MLGTMNAIACIKVQCPLFYYKYHSGKAVLCLNFFKREGQRRILTKQYYGWRTNCLKKGEDRRNKYPGLQMATKNLAPRIVCGAERPLPVKTYERKPGLNLGWISQNANKLPVIIIGWEINLGCYLFFCFYSFSILSPQRNTQPPTCYRAGLEIIPNQAYSFPKVWRGEFWGMWILEFIA